MRGKGAPIAVGVPVGGRLRRHVYHGRLSTNQNKQEAREATMKKNELLDRMRAGTLSRRQFAQILAGAGLAFTTMGVRGARADDQAIYFTWSGYDDPGFFPGYVKKYGTNPALPVFATADEALTKIRGGFQVDVAHPCNLDLKRWREADVLQPIDTSRLANWKDLFPSLTQVAYAHDNGKQYFVPIDWGNTSVLYRPDLVEIKEESWSLLFDERYKGKLSMSGDAADAVPIAGIVNGAKDPFNMTADELAAAKALLLKQKPLLRFYWDSNTTVEQSLQSGEIVASSAWNSSLYTLTDQGVNVKFMYPPKEGIMAYVCGLVITKNAPHLDKAYDLIDAISSPEAGVWLINYGYGHSNKKALELAGDALLKKRNLPKNPDEFFAKCILQKPMENVDNVLKMFEEVKASA
jgi:spermidine/putrescine transport system substrate-binding protein